MGSRLRALLYGSALTLAALLSTQSSKTPLGSLLGFGRGDDKAFQERFQREHEATLAVRAVEAAAHPPGTPR